jgi:hypothetical protein
MPDSSAGVPAGGSGCSLWRVARQRPARRPVLLRRLWSHPLRQCHPSMPLIPVGSSAGVPAGGSGCTPNRVTRPRPARRPVLLRGEARPLRYPHLWMPPAFTGSADVPAGQSGSTPNRVARPRPARRPVLLRGSGARLLRQHLLWMALMPRW